MSSAQILLHRVPIRLLLVAGAIMLGANLHVWLPGSLLVLVLLAGAIGLARLLGSAPMAFLVAGLGGVVVLGVPLDRYVERLIASATNPDLVLVFVAVAVFALVARLDLQRNAERAAQQLGASSPTAIVSERQARVLCVFRRMSDAVAAWRSPTWRFMAYLALVLSVFVGSQTSVVLFRSLWGGDRDFVEDSEARRIAAGILVLCVAGSLAAFSGALLRSPWWVFYDTTLAGMGLQRLCPLFPVGVLTYALCSAVHGVALTRVATVELMLQPLDAMTRQKQAVYLWLLIGNLVILSLLILAWRPVVRVGQDTTQMQVPTASPAPTCGPVASPTSSPGPGPTPRVAVPKATQMTRSLIGVLLVGAGALLLAQAFLFRDFMRADRYDWLAANWEMMRSEMKDLFGSIVSLVILVSFASLLATELQGRLGARDGPHDGLVQWAQHAPLVVPVTAVITTGVAGWFLGSAWASFALGAAVLSLAAWCQEEVWMGRALVETLILIGAFCNQTRPRADNVLLMFGDRTSSETVERVMNTPSWKAPAIAVQAMILVVSIVVAWVAEGALGDPG